MTDEIFDVAVVGAGPAGSSAARVSAESGARTVLLDRATFPRYKTCGGGLIGVTLAHLPSDLELPVQQHVDTATFTRTGRTPLTRHGSAPFLTLVDRTEFDAALVQVAVRRGVHTALGVSVTGCTQDGELVTLDTAAGSVRARAVVGADGSASRLARAVGVRLARIDLGLEVELGEKLPADWSGRIHIDWGPEPGSYGWVFAKRRGLTVGVIDRKGRPRATRAYLADFLTGLGVADLPERFSSGHLTRCRTADSPLGDGRILLAGDAAGLLEPLTREGISYAVRSGELAGAGAAALARGTAPQAVQASYTRQITSTLGREMLAGAAALRMFERRPGIVHNLLRYNPWAWRQFVKIADGRISLQEILDRPVVRRSAGLLSR